MSPLARRSLLNRVYGSEHSLSLLRRLFTKSSMVPILGALPLDGPRRAGGEGKTPPSSGALSNPAAHRRNLFDSAEPERVDHDLNTSVLSMNPCTISEPGPEAVNTASSALCKPSEAECSKLPTRRTAPGTSLYSSLATYCFFSFCARRRRGSAFGIDNSFGHYAVVRIESGGRSPDTFLTATQL